MTQDERWMKNYQEVMDFIKTNKRNPSKYEPEEKAMVNWQKQQRKLVNAGLLKQERVGVFNMLLALAEKYKRILLSVELFIISRYGNKVCSKDY